MDGEETVRLVGQIKPHILLLDPSLPKLSGVEVLAELSKLGSRTRTILLTGAIEKEQVVEALQLGVRGIVSKQSSLQLLLKSIRCVNAGQYWVGHDGVSDLIQALRRLKSSQSTLGTKRNFGLSSRELDVIALIVAGYTNKDLAQKLGITENTAKHHLTNIFDKLGVSSRTELLYLTMNHWQVRPQRPANGESQPFSAIIEDAEAGDPSAQLRLAEHFSQIKDIQDNESW
jgi:two-component system nitrate/nitrite response regulator NarL